MKLYVLCGLPGSGKTTYSTQLANEYNAKIYHFDDFRLDYYKHYYDNDTRLIMYKQIVTDLQNGYDVIVDDLHVDVKSRKMLLDALSSVVCTKNIIVMTTPMEECILRDSKRYPRVGKGIIKFNSRRYQPPSFEEGWDDIYFI